MIPTKIIQGLVRDALPTITVIQQNQEARAPSKPYCSWRRMSSLSSGRETVNHGTTGGATFLENVDLVKTQKVEVQFYTFSEEQLREKGETDPKVAEQYADEFITRLQGTNSKIYQRNNDIGLMTWNDFTAFAQFLGDKFEQRAIVEIELNYVDNYQEESFAVDPDTIDIITNYEGI